MNFSNIKSKLKNQLNSSADRYLSAKIKDELGLNKPTIESLHALSQSPGFDDDLNTFYKPVNSTFLSTKDYKNIQKWAVSFIVILTIALVFLFFSMILPHKDYSNALQDTQIVVDGNTVNEAAAAEKIEEEVTIEEDEATEELEVENIELEQAGAEKIAQKSPLLQGSNTVLEHTIKSGDTLEVIAIKYYGNSSPSTVDKLKIANKIRNARLIQVGQKIIIPM